MNNIKPYAAFHVDVFDCFRVFNWQSQEQIEEYISQCSNAGIRHLYIRLSVVGTFVHRTSIERQVDIDKPGKEFLRPAGNFDVLKTCIEAGRKHNIRIIPWMTMFDEGWAPRLKGQTKSVEDYNLRHYGNIKIMGDDLNLYDYIPNVEKWFDKNVPKGFQKVIPAIEQSQGLDADDIWANYSLFARNNPQFLTQDKYGYKLGRCLSYSYDEAKKYRLSLIQEVLEYGCDSICLDMTRWPCEHDTRLFDNEGVNHFGYDPLTVKTFEEKYGKDISSVDNADSDWIQHRCDTGATAFLEYLNNQIPDIRIHTMVLMADSKQQAFLDPATWLKKNLVEKILPFEFGERYGILNRAVDSPLQPKSYRGTYFDWVNRWADKDLPSENIEMCINMGFYHDGSETVYNKRLMTPDELKRLLKICNERNISGLSLYEACHVRKNHYNVIAEHENKSSHTEIKPNLGLASSFHSDTVQLQLNVNGDDYLPERALWFLDDKLLQDIRTAPMTVGRWTKIVTSDGKIPERINLEPSSVKPDSIITVKTEMAGNKYSKSWEINITNQKLLIEPLS